MAMFETHLRGSAASVVRGFVYKAIAVTFMGSMLVTAEQSSHAAGRTIDGIRADIVVAQDGSGDYKTVQTALDGAPAGAKKPFVIYIKPGAYHEKLTVTADRTYIHLVGASPDTTTLTYGDYARQLGADGKPIGTFRTPSLRIQGDNFSAQDLTFENSAGDHKIVAQAVAVAVDADRCTFENCRFLAHQDTLYANGGRQFYHNCLIAGDVDFIFGNASAVFQNCEIRSLGQGYVTAQSRISADQPSGYVIVDSRLTGPAAKASVYLGRPWRPYARVVYIDSVLGEHIRPQGWDNWRDPAREKTAFFAEYGSSGAGADAKDRVAWSHQLSQSEASAFLPQTFLKGSDGWSPGPPAFIVGR